SLWAPDDPTQPHHRPADHPHEHLVVNEAEAVAHFLTSLKHEPRATPPCVDCLLDNAGFELLGDLCLADYLLSTAQVQTVRVHAKLHPTFVSDAIMVDVHATIAWLRHHADSALRTLGERLHAYVRHRCDFSRLMGSGPILVICHSGIPWHPAGVSLIYLHTPA